MRRTLDTVLPDDVYLVSYPRSGSTWVRCVLASLLLGEAVRPEVVEATLPDVHRVDPGARPAVHPLIVKSHAPVFALTARLLYLVRDGRTAMASYYHRQLTLDRAPTGAMAAFALDPDVWPCPWDEHVDGWLAAIDERPAGSSLLVRYEDLVADPLGGFTHLAAWCGIAATDAAVEAAVAWNQEDAMRAIEEQEGLGSLNHVGSGAAGGLDARTTLLLTQRWTDPLVRLGYPVEAMT